MLGAGEYRNGAWGCQDDVDITNASSKKVDNHVWAIAPYYMHYNFCRVYQTSRVTPAMEAGIAEHVSSIEELVSLLDRSAKIAA
jgi:hypothetical protein